MGGRSSKRGRLEIPPAAFTLCSERNAHFFNFPPRKLFADCCLALSLSPFLTLGVTRLPESLCEGVVVDLELGDLLVLVGCDGDELGLLEHVRPEGGIRQLGNITGPDKVEPRLVLVHRVQNGLQCVRGILSVS